MFENLELQPSELEEARVFWVKETQAEYFSEDLRRLRESKSVARGSQLFRLVPFLDADGVMRLTGRLHKSALEVDFKHPGILSSDSRFTELVLRQAHHGSYHGGVQLMLATLKRRYWILGGRRVVKALIYRCVTCARFRGVAAKQLMGQLPRRRITSARLFLHCGIDYAGPLMLPKWRGRGAKTYKGFMVVFVCFTTSAVHIELATDYSTEAFLACFKRFTARRGICETITSDQSINLVGPDRELRSLFDAAGNQAQTIAHPLAQDGTKWIFNPPGAPHHGGKWEAALKSAKVHLKRVIGDATLTYEELFTLLTQVEAILNSRPLCELADDPDEFAVLTPGHFIIGSALSTVPEPSLLHLPVSRLSRYQLIRQMVGRFWELWCITYLQKLQSFSKWQKDQPNLQLGSSVLIVDERLPPTKWPMGRITQLHLGKDGLCRVVTVETQASVFTRPVTKVCPLPVETASAGDAGGV
ncbi:uncharacterized protein LOC107042773 [Diachasma alloeum]|uniref:uncharacterized protein LOC107042773 n=1 Tax=Diachasma alloeum TaxID=454923 RepID=UPI0007384FDD|nr:uncharacterized protein LOC107042773 [Diachasma alloeum]